MQRPAPTATPELTWRVATVIHERCCAHSGCDGPFLHLSEAAAAVDALLAHRPPALPPTSGWHPPRAA